MERIGGRREVGTDGLLDAERFLQFTAALKELHQRIGRARLSRETKQRWERRLATIAEVAQRDLDRAEAQLRRLTDDVDRATRRR